MSPAGPVRVEGVDYSHDGIEDIRQQLAIARNGAMDQGEMAWVVILSHAIAQLAYLQDMLKEPA